eukprot:TRINITY_DN723_c0_g1_i3.p1 TRINITY_DN723_c0_g1~~TRINITY_DN723_c0_g1_i3.p1  ORF type:complete len:686 (+),score=150.28 TRINITY_DN723_c0_g1_i3:870-2927(+)
MQGSELKAETSMSVYTVSPTATCPGMLIEETSSKKTCWTGSVSWVQGTGSSQMNGFFECTYVSGDSFPVALSYYERDQSRTPPQTDSMKLATTADGTSVRTLMGREASSNAYYCLNSNQNFARVSKHASAIQACTTSSSGGQCLSRTSKTSYPFTMIPFREDTGALATASGTVSLSLDYTKNSKRCHAGVSGDGAYMSCGEGQPSESDMIAEGGSATDSAGTTYTLHHSSKIQKFVVVEMTLAEFSGAYYFSHWQMDNSFSPGRFYQYILSAGTSSNTVMTVAYKRYYVSSAWTDFVAGTGGETVTLPSSDVNFHPCWQQARYYTGADKPTTGEWWGKFFVQTNSEYTYDPTNGVVYLAKSNGLLQVGSTDVDMICPLLCLRENSGTCQEYTHCPKQSFSGITPSNSCTGSSCTYYPYSSDTAFKYTFKTTDAQLYTYTDNSAGSISATVVDGRTGVTYDSSNQWSQTTEAYMYPGSSTALFDTEAEVAAYKKVDGNVFYKVGIGMLGGYSGWGFYAKKTSDSQFVQLVDPISCTLTMSTAYDANGGSQFNGAKFELTFYGMYTSGLSWEQLTFGNSEVGTRQNYVPAPQIANGAQCVGSSTTYRLKSEFTMVFLNEASNPSTDCSSFNSMTSPGSLPTNGQANQHIPSWRGSTTPTPDKTCIDQQSLTNNGGCSYYAGVTSTKG